MWHIRLAARSLLPVLMLLAATVPARAGIDPEVDAEIARLRSTLAARGLEEQQCLAGAAQGLASPLARAVREMEERARENGRRATGREAEAWKELERRAQQLAAQQRAQAASGAVLLQVQLAGVECLERSGAERDAFRASLRVALTDPAAYRASLRDARENGGRSLARDLPGLRATAEGLADLIRARAAWEETEAAAAALRDGIAAVYRRHTVALQGEASRGLADPVLRAAEALVATVEAWGRERAAAARAEAAAAPEERLRAARERADAAGAREARWAAAQGLLLAAPRPAD